MIFAEGPGQNFPPGRDGRQCPNKGLQVAPEATVCLQFRRLKPQGLNHERLPDLRLLLAQVDLPRLRFSRRPGSVL